MKWTLADIVYNRFRRSEVPGVYVFGFSTRSLGFRDSGSGLTLPVSDGEGMLGFRTTRLRSSCDSGQAPTKG